MEVRVSISDGSRTASIIVPVVVQSTPDMSKWYPCLHFVIHDLHVQPHHDPHAPGASTPSSWATRCSIGWHTLFLMNNSTLLNPLDVLPGLLLSAA